MKKWKKVILFLSMGYILIAIAISILEKPERSNKNKEKEIVDIESPKSPVKREINDSALNRHQTTYYRMRKTWSELTMDNGWKVLYKNKKKSDFWNNILILNKRFPSSLNKYVSHVTVGRGWIEIILKSQIHLDEIEYMDLLFNFAGKTFPHLEEMLNKKVWLNITLFSPYSIQDSEVFHVMEKSHRPIVVYENTYDTSRIVREIVKRGEDVYLVETDLK